MDALLLSQVIVSTLSADDEAPRFMRVPAWWVAHWAAEAREQFDLDRQLGRLVESWA